MTAYTDNDLRHRLIGRFLKLARESADLTQHDVAHALAYSSPQFISNWERGVSLPPLEVLPKLSEIYRVAPRQFIDALERYHLAVMKRRRQILTALFRDARRT